MGLAPSDRMLRSLLYWGPNAARLAVVQGDKQLMYDWWGEVHLYDHAKDPMGVVDYYNPHDVTVQPLRDEIDAFAEEIQKQWPSVGDRIIVW